MMGNGGQIHTRGGGGGRQQKSLIFISRSVTLNNRSVFHTTLSYGAFRDLPQHKSTHSLTLKLQLYSNYKPCLPEALKGLMLVHSEPPY